MTLEAALAVLPLVNHLSFPKFMGPPVSPFLTLMVFIRSTVTSVTIFLYSRERDRATPGKVPTCILSKQEKRET
jgi:hypothetical protein